MKIELSRRQLLGTTMAAGALNLGGYIPRSNATGPMNDLINNSLTWDNHGCMPLRPNDFSFLDQLQRYKKSGFNIVALNVGFDAVPFELTFQMLAHFRHWLIEHDDDYLLINGVKDIERARSEDKLGVFFDIEGAAAIRDQISLIDFFYGLGVRWMSIAYNLNNRVGGGCQDDDSGLTEFGKKVLDRMAKVGMVACCSHTGYRTTMDVMDHSENPVIFSHSNPLGLWQHERNIRDEAIDACASTGGVICLNGIGIFLGDNDASSEIFANHIDYVVQRVGPESVGIGLDYVFDRQELDDFVKSHPETFPPEKGYDAGIEMVMPEQLPEIVSILQNRGYSDDNLRMILGENLLRVAQVIWQ